MSKSTEYLAHNLRRSLEYGTALAADIPAEKFTHKPHPTMNNPAWCYGHLSLYPDRLFPMMGRPDLADVNERYDRLFAAGTEAVDDPSRYPTKDEIVTRFRERYLLAVETLPDVSDETLAAANPNERFAKMFPRVGDAVHFIFANHIMMHLGQVSSWRRAVGLPSVM